MVEIPRQVIQLGLAILSLGAISSFAGFFLGWLKMKKNWRKIDLSLILIGLGTTGLGLATYTGLFLLDFISPGQNFQVGMVFTPIGAVLIVIGMLKPCEFNLQISDR